MMSVIGILDTTKLALSSFQAAIDITGSNISNVNTPGYSRQRPVFSSVGSIDVRAAKIKVGVEVSDVERIYNNFLCDQEIRLTNGPLSLVIMKRFPQVLKVWRSSLMKPAAAASMVC